ncbi:hypothetical protein [Microbacterium sp. MM2322]|uniref:hypothetical protein n=1 Tax=Microbacterium sp. MM2322 TaxID=3157631 RepID=UPI0032D56CC0
MAEPQETLDEQLKRLVILPFGRYFAARADLLTREGVKTCEPIDGVSPFSAMETKDDAVGFFTTSPRTTSRSKIDTRKDLRRTFVDSGADFLVVDNTSALMNLREMRGRFYTVDAQESSDLMDWLWNDDAERAQADVVRPNRTGLDERLAALYGQFIEACLDVFPPSRIVLIRSHVARFWVGQDGELGTTNADDATDRLLNDLDSRFADATGCVVVDAAFDWFPRHENWIAPDPAVRVAIEASIMRAVRVGDSSPHRAFPSRSESPASLISWYLRHGADIDRERLERAFSTTQITPGDLVALAALASDRPEDSDVVRTCVRLAVSASGAELVRRSVERATDSWRALRESDVNAVPLPRDPEFQPHIRVDSGQGVVFRFNLDGSHERIEFLQPDCESSTATEPASVSLRQVVPALSSWEFYLARARRGDASGFTAHVASADELMDSCSWLDWRSILHEENVSISLDADVPRVTQAKTDLTFLFDPGTRVVTVGGGLMDQVQHLSLYDSLCRSAGVSYVVDDMRYTWWRSHNGFEAGRLAPELEGKRLSRKLSRPLLERFRTAVESCPPTAWLYRQSEAWNRLGLRGAVVVAKNHENSRRYVAANPAFPVLLYRTHAELAALIERPPAQPTLFTSQDGIERDSASAEHITALFDYANLIDGGEPRSVVEMAAKIAAAPCAAFHVRRGDYLQGAFDTEGWHSATDHYRAAMEALRSGDFGDVHNVAVFSDDIQFVRDHAADYGLDLVRGEVLYVEGNRHFDSIYDSYLISRCEVVIGSVGFFSMMSALLADPLPTFVHARPNGVRTLWSR